MKGIHAVIAAALVGVATTGVAVLLFDEPTGGDAQKRLRADALRVEAAEIGAVVVDDGDAVVTLRRGDGGWRVVEKAGYPAADRRVSRLLDALSNARVLESVEASPDRFAALGVGRRDEGGWDLRLRLENVDGETVAEVVVGKERSAPAATEMSAVYLRRVGARRVWLVDGDLRPDADPEAWLDREVFALPRENIYEVRTLPARGEPLVLRRESPSSPNFQLADGTAAADAERLGAAGEVLAAFGSIVFEDVAAAPEAEPPDDHGYVRTMDGSRIAYWFESANGATWTRFRRERVPAIATEAGGTSGSDGPAGASDAPAGARLASDVRLRDWAFALPAYTVARLRRAAHDVVAEDEREKAETDGGASE